MTDVNSFGRRIDCIKGVYEGQFQDGKCQGRGTYKFVNGNEYNGEWKRGLPDGKGMYLVLLRF